MIAGVSDLQAGAGGIVVLIIIAVLSGLLIPRWTVKQLMKATQDALSLKDSQLEFKDRQINMLVESNENYRKANERLVESSSNMIAVNEVATKALHALTASAHQGEPDEIAQANAPSEA